MSAGEGREAGVEDWPRRRRGGSISARVIGFTAILIGLTLLVLTLSAYFRE
jgi:hypothetical protein